VWTLAGSVLGKGRGTVLECLPSHEPHAGSWVDHPRLTSQQLALLVQPPSMQTKQHIVNATRGQPSHHPPGRAFSEPHTALCNAVTAVTPCFRCDLPGVSVLCCGGQELRCTALPQGSRVHVGRDRAEPTKWPNPRGAISRAPLCRNPHRLFDRWINDLPVTIEYRHELHLLFDEVPGVIDLVLNVRISL